MLCLLPHLLGLSWVLYLHIQVSVSLLDLSSLRIGPVPGLFILGSSEHISAKPFGGHANRYLFSCLVPLI